MTLTLFPLTWYLVGIASFIYWWTKDYDFGTTQILLALFVGIMGPFTFLVGYGLHGKSMVIFKKKQ